MDSDRGVVLRSVARIHGEPFRILTIERVSFDEELGDEMFAPPKDKQFEPVRLPRDVTLSELPGPVAFTVLIPEHPPFAVDYTTIHPTEGGIPEQLHIAFASGLPGEDELHFWLVESAHPLHEERSVEWRETEGMRYGYDLRVTPPLRVVQLERLGTYVELRAYFMAIEDLLDLARSLVPLSDFPSAAT